MNRSFFLSVYLLVFCCAYTGMAQNDVHITINTSLDRTPISPYIYGSNGQSDDRDEHITARRIGGNRLTGYNWENNASNAGSDWEQSSDNYLTWLAGIPSSQENRLGIVLTSFHDTSLAMNTYSLVTLQMAGYVARDKNGSVAEAEAAPSSRWAQIINKKPGGLSTSPDVTDNVVYTDELLFFLVGKYGSAATSTGIKAYSLDNEPALWAYTHPRIVRSPITVKSLIARSIDLASTVKRVDPSAEVFGPALYGFTAYRTLQDAPDWNEYQNSYPWFIHVYLDSMRHASEKEGVRLLDVLDVHWYPEPQGVYAGDTSPSVAEARMQAPRSLWDSSYTENSWIGQWFSPVALLHNLHAAVDEYYPGTKLAITEYNYGAANHISGGIAQADALGIFGKYGVYFASHWGALDGYVSSAYKLFRNYDGLHSTFAETSVYARTDNNDKTSVYASVESSGVLHIILLNKDANAPLATVLTLDGGVTYSTPEVWKFDASDSALTSEIFTGSLTGSSLTTTLAPLTAYHLVLRPAVTSVEETQTQHCAVRAVAAADGMTVFYTVPQAHHSVLTLTDMMGRVVYSSERTTAEDRVFIPVHSLSAGLYLVTIQSGTATASATVFLAR